MKRLSLLATLGVAVGAGILPAAANAQSFHLVEASIDDIQAQYRAGRLSPDQLVRMYLARIAAYDRSSAGQPLNGGVGQQPLNAFMHVNQQAINDARRLGDDFDDFGEEEDDDDDWRNCCICQAVGDNRQRRAAGWGSSVPAAVPVSVICRSF